MFSAWLKSRKLIPISKLKPEEHERFAQWRERTRTQLGLAIQFFTALSAAGVAFIISMIRDTTFNPQGKERGVALAALSLLLIAVISGSVAVVTRLLDFRYTAQKIRACEEDQPWLKKNIDFVSRLTWFFLWVMLITLLLGIISLALEIFFLYGHKLFGV